MEIADLYVYTSILIAVLFVVLIVLIVQGFFRTPAVGYHQPTSITVIVPFKNESQHIRKFLNTLKSVMPADGTVVVQFIDDHSDDLTPELIAEMRNTPYFQFRTLPDNLHGKKNAVQYGIKNAKAAWILLLDIDTLPEAGLFTFSKKLIPKGAKMVLVPLHPVKSKGIISAFFDLDFLSLHFTGLGLARRNIPVLANAAALYVNREAYLAAGNIRSDWNEPSGDDIFAMMAIKKLYGPESIKVVPDKYPLASVHFPQGFKALWNQRLRWVSKVGRVKNLRFQIVSWIVLLTQILLLSGYCFFIFAEPNALTTTTMPTVVLSEILLLSIACRMAQRSELLVYIIPAVLIYPFYLLALLISSVFKRPAWK